MSLGISLVVQWLRICLPVQGMRVRSLVRELKSHMPRNEALAAKLKKPAPKTSMPQQRPSTAKKMKSV